jgi:hypothetical protein
MKTNPMQYFTNWDMTMLSSLGALILSFVADSIQEPNVMAWISGISAFLLCLTSIVKFVDLVFEKWHKWKGKE